jgi:hypothetical protein
VKPERAGLPRCRQQFLAADKQIHQRAGNKQPLGILLQPAIAYFHKAELQLHHLKHVLDLRPHARLRPILGPGHFIHDLTVIAAAPLREIPRSRRTLADHLALPWVGAVTPPPRFFSVQQVGQNGHIG